MKKFIPCSRRRPEPERSGLPFLAPPPPTDGPIRPYRSRPPQLLTLVPIPTMFMLRSHRRSALLAQHFRRLPPPV